MDGRIAAAKATLGSECIILGHHYQRDEVVRFADYRGDSYRLSQMAAQAKGSYIVFCGVHFMAESADILARPGQAVVLPDLNAGCSMADMAEISQVEDAWEQLVNLGLTDDEGSGITPITYMNSTAAIKAFCGERGGMVCTSSNAKGAFEWALRRNGKIFFLPDQHLGRNTGYARGIPLDEMVVWDPYMLQGGQTAERLAQSQSDSVEGTLLGASAFSAGACGQSQGELSGHSGHRSSRVPLGGLPEGGRNRLDRPPHQGCAGSAGRIVVRHRHGDSPGEPAGEGESGQARHHARRLRLPVHDHVPHLAAAPLLGAGKPGGRQRCQSDQGKRQREEVGARGA